MKKPPIAEACQCEHVDHEQPNEAVHPYLAAPAGKRRAFFVGHICDDCAATHMAEYLETEPAAEGGKS